MMYAVCCMLPPSGGGGGGAVVAAAAAWLSVVTPPLRHASHIGCVLLAAQIIVACLALCMSMVIGLVLSPGNPNQHFSSLGSVYELGVLNWISG